jgi:isoleucyl-tRNA synthetase
MKFVMNRSLYLGSKPVMWSPVEKTALAEAEVEYHDHQSPTIWVKFPVVSGPDLLRGAAVVIWTTTPWTIPSNRGVAFNPGVGYGLYEVTGRPEECWARIGDRYVLADALAEGVLAAARLERGMWRRLGDVPADALAGVVCAHPFARLHPHWDYEVPALPGDFVTDDAGTGFVHLAPSHGADDYELFVKAGLVERMTHNVLEDSSFAAHVPFFAGLQVSGV